MDYRSFNSVRTQRLRWGLSSKDLSALIGRDPTKISRLEKRMESLTGRTVLALMIVFGVPARTLFPGMYEQIEETVMERAAHLYKVLERRNDAQSVKRRELLTDMMRRATSSTDFV